jgi:hypothetical protein
VWRRPGPGESHAHDSYQRDEPDDPNDPNAVYHVAMWVGSGQIMEAPRAGVPLRITAMRWASTMPYAGRP